MTPKITPSKPRSAISHQFCRNALFRTVDLPDDGLNRYGLSVAVFVLMARSCLGLRIMPRECRRIRCQRDSCLASGPLGAPKSGTETGKAR
jgi:hypothetical protein